MRILLDENLPRRLVVALRTEGHEVESVHTLRLQGVDNGSLYRVALGNFDLCFSGDAGFANNVRQNPAPPEFKLLRVTLPQKPQDQFIDDFLQPFRSSDWNRYRHGDDWP